MQRDKETGRQTDMTKLRSGDINVFVREETNRTRTALVIYVHSYDKEAVVFPHKNYS
jgi:hypothetical protein